MSIRLVSTLAEDTSQTDVRRGIERIGPRI
jgi:hypothetical protein